MWRKKCRKRKLFCGWRRGGGGKGEGWGVGRNCFTPLYPVLPPPHTHCRYPASKCKLVESLYNNDGDQFVKCWQILLELNFKGLYRSSKKEKESRCLVLTFSIKREFRHFHVVVVVQWRKRNVQKSVMHVQSCCFANLYLLLFCRSRWRHRSRCLSSLMST